ncbi:hypothetical protein GGR32_000971 [Mesonia hippocampi]|uniref:Uncharacterized protein n=1 Tax=Mesonia hippocampi TaxID=1628250 RepID=A0A840ENQ0_9FLAO|nr:hypothetical protein [Mesonia hippocampi]MBB4118691.1 hypothetical protein [Mesonia hippocampi]
MKPLLTLLFFTSLACAQNNITEQKITNNTALKPENALAIYNNYNFANLWIQDRPTLGILGKNHQRLKIKILSVKQDINNLNKYSITGKYAIKGKIYNFTGSIGIIKIREVKNLHFGVDNEYESHKIKSQGILIAEYKFKEDSLQKNTGIFKGKLYSKWYLSAKDEIKYDDIELFSDGYFNNAFIGTWQPNINAPKKIANWGDYRVPNANDDFDIGAGEFFPSKKYISQGWEDYSPTEKENWWK